MFKSVEKPSSESHPIGINKTVMSRGNLCPPGGLSSERLLVKDHKLDLGEVGEMTESVLGSDDRIPILDSDESPWRSICALQIVAGRRSFIGTGWFAGPSTVITAGHCVYDARQMGGWATEIVVSPGRRNDSTPFGVTSSRRFASVDAWVDDRDPDADYGVIHLEEPLGLRTGWFGFGMVSDAQLNNRQVNVSGYPADKGGQSQWFHRNSVLRLTQERIFYDVDTFGGQSGSPVWIYPDGSEEALVVGIHAYGIGGTPGRFNISANSAPRINQDAYDIIQYWRTLSDSESVESPELRDAG